MADFQRVLVTGASGFVGSHLRGPLAQLLPNAEFRLMTRSTRLPLELPWAAGELTEPDEIEKVFKSFRPDLIVHLAAQASIVAANNAPGDAWLTNVGGAIALARAVARHAPSATVLNVSSGDVYGKTLNAGPVKETSELCPISTYGRTKQVAEIAFEDILPESARLITVRPFNHTGPGQSKDFVVPAFAHQIVAIKRASFPTPMRVGNLDAERDFLDVRDVVGAYVNLIRQSDVLPRRAVYNVSSGRTVRMSRILDLLLSMADRPIVVERDPDRMRASEIQRSVGDSSLIRGVTGWSDRYTIEQTLRDIYQFISKQQLGSNVGHLDV
jgi:GDP-4-dehydro-6-deoxy-D-mannose reductase